METVVGGKFDPLHDGHIDHIVKAAQLGDWLIVVTHPDENVRGGKPNIPLWARMATLKGILKQFNIRGEVVLSKDKDGTMVETLKHYKPDIFAKGGDRTPDNMDRGEIETCERLGIRIEYGVGELLNASSKIKTTP